MTTFSETFSMAYSREPYAIALDSPEMRCALPGIAMRVRSFPCNFIMEIVSAKNVVSNNLYVIRNSLS